MPSVTINEKDYTIFNKGYETDNIVYVPGFTIRGPYDEPVLLATYADLVNTFGNLPPETYYASASTDATKELCSSWEYAAQLLNDGFMVLFQRIVPYKILETSDSAGNKSYSLIFDELDEDVLTPASTIIMEGRFNQSTVTGDVGEQVLTTVSNNGAYLKSRVITVTDGETTREETVYEAYISQNYPYSTGGSTPDSVLTNGIKISEKTGGTYGNRLQLQFVLNTARNKLFYKLIDTYKGTTILEYKEICSIITDNSGNISWKYLLSFAKGFVSAINSSEYIKTDATVDEINNYIVAVLNHINGTDGYNNGIKLRTTRDGYIIFTEDSIIPYDDFTTLPTKPTTTDNNGNETFDTTTYNANLFKTYYVGNADYGYKTVNEEQVFVGYYAQYSCFIDTLIVHSSASFTDTNDTTKLTSKYYNRSSWAIGNPLYTVNLVISADNMINNIGLVTSVLGKNYTINDAIVDFNRYYYTKDAQGVLVKSDSPKSFNASENKSFLCDTLVYTLKIISDMILYDVKFVTYGAIPVGGSKDKDGDSYTTGLVPTVPDEDGDSYDQIVANFCKNRGDCVAVLNPGIGESDAVGVPDLFLDVAGVPASYTAVYAPWCTMILFNGYQKWCPPSLIFLDALAESVASGNPVYLPPAGVNRASLPKVVEPEYKIGSTILNDWQDKNQLRNINPIMYMNTYGYVIFGQRTLYDVSDSVTTYRSALQELGVRLVTIELKKKIRQVAMGLIFQYNNIHTWNEFKAGLKPLMEKMLCEGALQRYQIIMDETTTSADDIDDNIIRGTVKIVPGRAAEDFIISFELYRSNVTFDDEEEVNGY